MGQTTQEAAAALQARPATVRLVDVVDDTPLTVWSYKSREGCPSRTWLHRWCCATIRETRKDEPPFLCGPPPAASPARLDASERRRLRTGPVHGEALGSGVRTKATRADHTSSQDPRACGKKKKPVSGSVIWGPGCCCCGWVLGRSLESQGLSKGAAL